MKIFDSEKRQTANARDLRERASQPAARGKENLEQDQQTPARVRALKRERSEDQPEHKSDVFMKLEHLHGEDLQAAIKQEPPNIGNRQAMVIEEVRNRARRIQVNKNPTDIIRS